MIDTPANKPFTLVVGIPTLGRREVLRETLSQLEKQERRPDRILICPVRGDDVDWEHAGALAIPVERIDGPQGSCAQRNAILDAVGDADAILFLDDDYVLADGFIAEVERLFLQYPDIAAVTAHTVVDGVRGPGIDMPEVLAILAKDQPPETAHLSPVDVAPSGDSAFRIAAIRQAGARFDENLPLYAWCEDVDFSGQFRGQGRIVLSTALRGVHRGVKRGRTSGLRFGYSQIANPIYVVRKGTMRRSRAVRFVVGNLAANLLGSLWPQGSIDRRGRLKGNLLALWDLVRGRLAPQRILTLG